LKTLNPDFPDVLLLDLRTRTADVVKNFQTDPDRTLQLSFRVYDYDLGKNDFIGQWQVSVRELMDILSHPSLEPRSLTVTDVPLRPKAPLTESAKSRRLGTISFTLAFKPCHYDS
jgi:hypothetical protein